eukprot:TRINITY_DN14712_c0_g1_i1.p1 TRINITY_DN14712_c0_g1~~TRINITY_DN14712_c0_g1_i1.p1  ORF type:complete len:2123 (-),score=549.27 TRINITY_DN14712_c0_g1_i1:16-6384(-)
MYGYGYGHPGYMPPAMPAMHPGYGHYPPGYAAVPPHPHQSYPGYPPPAMVPGYAAIAPHPHHMQTHVAAPAPRHQGEERYFAITDGDDAGEFVIQTLTGEYQRKGENHERPFYQKLAPRPGMPAPEVFIYFWDGRDGSSFEGWWFGKSVGGNEVWSHCPEKDMLPPLKGWKIPFQGDARKTFSVLPKSQKSKKDNAKRNETLKALEKEADEAIVDSTKAVEKARAANPLDAVNLDVDKIRAAQADINPHVQIMLDIVRKVESEALGDNSRALMRKLREAQNAVAQETQKLKIALPKATFYSQQKEAELRDDKRLEGIMVEVNESYNAADDLVQKSELTFELIEQAGEDENEALKAADETETIAKQAQVAIKDALAAIGVKLALLREFESEGGRLKATDALGILREKLRVSNSKVTPFLTTKAEAKMRVDAKKLEVELGELLAPAEAEIEQVEQVAEPLMAYAKVAQAAGEAAAVATATAKAKAAPKADSDKNEPKESIQKRTPPSPDVIDAAINKVNNAAATLLSLSKTLSVKRTSQNIMYAPAMQKVLDQAEERVRAGHKRLDFVRAAQKEIKEIETAKAFMKDIEDKMQAAEKATKVAEDTVRAIGSEGAVADAEDQALKAAAKAAQAAKICLSMRLLEVKRFTAEAGIEAQKILQDHQKKLQSALQKIEAAKAAAAEKKQMFKRKETLAKVEAAEEHAQKAEATAGIILDESQLSAMSSTEIREAGAITRKAADAANMAVAEAQKMITALQIEAKGTSASASAVAELTKLQARLKAAEAMVAPFAVLPDIVEQQLAVQSVIDTAEKQITSAEEKVEAAEALSKEAEENPFPEGVDPPMAPPDDQGQPSGSSKPKAPMLSIAAESPVDRAKTAVDTANAQLTNATAFVDARTAEQKIPEDDAKIMKARLDAAKQKLDTAEEKAQKGYEQRAILQLMGDTAKKATEAETLVEAAAELAAPLEKLMADEDAKNAQSDVKDDDREQSVAAGPEAGKSTPEKDTDADAKEEVPDSNSPQVSVLESSLAKMNAAAQAASKSLSAVKTAVAVKRIQAKRLPGNAADVCREQLDNLATRAEAAFRRLLEVRRASTNRQYERAKKEVVAKMEQAEKSMKSATDSFTALMEIAEDAEPALMQGELAKAAAAQSEANTAIAAARGPLQDRLAEASAEGVSSEVSEFVKDFQEMLHKLTPLQAELDDMRQKANEKEHKFVASCLMQEAGEIFENLEDKLKKMNTAAALLGSVGKDKILEARMLLGRILDALRSHLSAASKTPEQLFEELAIGSGDSGLIEASGIPAALRALTPELPDLPDLVGTLEDDEKLAVQAFSFLSSSGHEDDTCVVKDKFLDELKTRFLCVSAISMTDGMNVEHSKTLRKVEVAEVLEALDEAAKEPTTGLVRVRAKALKDDAEGFVTLAGSSDSAYLEAYTPFLAAVCTADTTLAEVSETVGQTITYLKQKNEELKNTRGSGPLNEVKAELTKLRVRASRAQASQSEIKRKIAEARKLHEVQLEALKKRQQDAADKKAADAIISDTTELVDQAVFKAGEVCDESARLVNGESITSISELMQSLKKSEADLQAVIDEVAQVQDKLMKIVNEDIKNVSQGPLLEARRLIFRLKVKLAPIPVNCKKQITALEAKKKAASQDAEQAVAASLQDKVKADSLSVDTLFAQLRSENDPPHSCTVRTEALKEFLKGHIDAEELQCGLASYPDTISRLGISGLVQQHRRCIKEVALTPNFEVKGSSPLRKLDMGEVLEVFGQPAKEESTGLVRTRCRAVKDLTDGWVTIFGNQGSTYLEKSDKPYLVCEAEAPLHESCSSSSSELRKLSVGEVMEVLEGPRPEPVVVVNRARGKAVKDGAVGWVLFKDQNSQCFFEAAKLMLCKASVALTDSFDIATCQAVRKLDVGERLDILEEPTEDEQRKLLRVQVRAQIDGKEGWVTVRGNQGTVFVERSKMHYKCTKDVQLAGGGKVPGKEHVAKGNKDSSRLLEAGEIFELLFEPTTERIGGRMLARAHSLNATSEDQPAEGWVVLGEAVLPLNLRQRCVQACTLMDGMDTETATVVRKLDAGETMELLDVPRRRDAESREMFSHVRATQDGAVGFLPFLGKLGKPALTNIGSGSHGK